MESKPSPLGVRQNEEFRSFFFSPFFFHAVHQGHSILSNSHYTQSCVKSEKKSIRFGAAGSAQFRGIVLTATIKTEGLSAAPLPSAVALMLVFSFSATSATDRLFGASLRRKQLFGFGADYRGCTSAGVPARELLATVSLVCQRLARHKGEARLNEALEVPVRLRLGAF